MRKRLLALGFAVLILGGCGSAVTREVDDNGFCIERERSWMIWQFDSESRPLDVEDCEVGESRGR